MQPPGTEDSAFFTFAVLDELIRTLVDKGVLSKLDAGSIFYRIAIGLEGNTRVQAKNGLLLAKKMVSEYSK
jgi:hypothetical protein